jgi:hypothetical protein
MRGPIAILAVACVAVGLFSFAAIDLLRPAVAQLSGGAAPGVLAGASGTLRVIAAVGGGLFGLIAALALLRRFLLRGRQVSESVTWDCGYARPTARMQYTASSFAQPLTDLFAAFLGTKKNVAPPRGYFPSEASLSTETPDAAREKLFAPAFRGAVRFMEKLSKLERGNVQLYALYVALALIVLLAWKL